MTDPVRAVGGCAIVVQEMNGGMTNEAGYRSLEHNN
jgi:hypothetical protein